MMAGKQGANTMPNREHERTKPESAKQETVTHSAEEEALMRAFRRGDDRQQDLILRFAQQLTC